MKYLGFVALLILLSLSIVSVVDAHRHDDCDDRICVQYDTPTPEPTVEPVASPSATLVMVTPQPVNPAKDPPEKSNPCYYSGVCVSSDPGSYPTSPYDGSKVGWK